jgi:DNA-directed RNA polymerase specialized sigma24 family protein
MSLLPSPRASRDMFDAAGGVGAAGSSPSTTGRAAERELAARAANGDAAALADVWARHGESAARAAARNGRVDHDAEAAAVEAVAPDRLRGYRGNGSLGGFLRGVASNIRRAVTRRQARDGARAMPLAELTAEPGDPTAADPAVQALVADLTARLTAGLSPDDRLLLERRSVDGASFVELAGEFGMNVNTVKSRYRRAMAQARAALAEVERETDRGGRTTR